MLRQRRQPRSARTAEASRRTCADRLEAADRLAELLGGPSRIRWRFAASTWPTRQPRQRARSRPDPRRAAAKRARRCGCIGEHDPSQRAGEVGGGQRLDRDTIGGGIDEQEFVLGGGQQQHPRGIGAQHKLDGAGCPAVLVMQVGRQRHARRALAGRQRLQQVRLRTRDNQRGNRGGGDRTGDDRGGGLVDHRAQVVDGAAGPTGLFGHRHAENAELGQTLVRRAPRSWVTLLDRGLPRRHRTPPPSYGPVHERQTARQCRSLMPATSQDS